MATLFWFLTLFTTQEEVAVANYHWDKVRPVWSRNNQKYRYSIFHTETKGDSLTTCHFTYDWLGIGLGWDQSLSWGTIRGRFHVFCNDREDRSGRVYRIQRNLLDDEDR